MIYDTLHNAPGLAGLGPRFAAAFAWLAARDLAALEPGRHDIDGDNLYVLIQHRALKSLDEAGWEAHRAYADIQLVIEGRERMGYALLDLPCEASYDAAKDYLVPPVEGGQYLDVGAGEFAVFLPHDAHRPLLPPEGAAPGTMVRKAVVKVKLPA